MNALVPVMNDLTTLLEILDRSMNVSRFSAESGLVDGCGIGNHPQLVLLDVNSVLVEGTFGPSHDVPHRPRVNGQDSRAQDYC